MAQKSNTYVFYYGMLERGKTPIATGQKEANNRPVASIFERGVLFWGGGVSNLALIHYS